MKKKKKEKIRKKREFPTVIEVCGWPYTIEKTTHIDENTMGELIPGEYKIKINLNKFPTDLKKSEQTLFHELLHAVFEQLGWDEKFKNDEDEAMVKALEHALFPIIKLRHEYFN